MSYSAVHCLLGGFSNFRSHSQLVILFSTIVIQNVIKNIEKMGTKVRRH